jgi:Polyketide cyclase / dehydrase and lipid transport
MAMQASNAYHFVTRWRVKATLAEVNAVLGDPTSLTRWWPSVYLDVRLLKPGDPVTGVGREIDLFTKGWLPYTLRWRFVVEEISAPHGFALTAHGDFVGRGVWQFAQDADHVNIVYDWRIVAEKPLLKLLSPVMKPVLSANHHWAMRMGLTSLELELRRRRGETVPPPPGPTFVVGR